MSGFWVSPPDADGGRWFSFSSDPSPADLWENLEEVLPKLLAENIRCFYLGLSSPTPGVRALGAALEVAPTDPVPAKLRAGITPRSPALFIYTSGTTGEVTQQP